MKKILAAVDGSSASIHAAKKAVELARAMGAEVTLIHVEPPLMYAREPFVTASEARDAEFARGAQVLREVSSTLEGEVKTENVIGVPANAIADTADEQNFDLVVVGNKGRGAVSRVLVGSVADRLVHICKRPVMVVR